MIPPALANNSLFLNYFQRWQHDPTSAAFVGVADLLAAYQCHDDAIRVCEEGLEHNPQLTTARLVLARSLEATGQGERAREVILDLLAQHPDQREARTIYARLTPSEVSFVPTARESPEISLLPDDGPIPLERPELPKRSARPAVPTLWKTLTMARLYAAQGHRRNAEEIYERILHDDPHNADAKEELRSMQGKVEDRDGR